MDPAQSPPRGLHRRLPRTRGDGPAGCGLPAPFGGLPRTRGDGPETRWPTTSRYRASPHTRGWTRRLRLRRARQHGFPAHAGMDPATAPSAVPSRRLPRTRGDGPPPPSPPTATQASPHTRGWTRRHRRPTGTRAGFPAHAGMDPGRCAAGRPGAGLPRTRGDGPKRRLTGSGLRSASPHTRGWTLRFGRRSRLFGGFPAHAGMDPSTRCPTRPVRRLPRTRGDGPGEGTMEWTERPASPHTRGWTHRRQHLQAVRLGFPAHAGMDPVWQLTRGQSRRLPRTRGDGPHLRGRWRLIWEASPHTRGWTQLGAQLVALDRGFPAHAGMDPTDVHYVYDRGGLPRTRGDGPYELTVSLVPLRASPHTRGWTPEPCPTVPDDEGFPAHAGMDPRRSPHSGRCGRLPRTRGDGPPFGPGPEEEEPASPHTRGWTRPGGGIQAPAHGFPAHAGMDPRASEGHRRRYGLPRTRGDGPGWPPR